MRSKGKPAHTGCHSLPWPFGFTHVKKRYHPLGSIPFHCWHILVWGTRPALRGGPGRGSDSPPGCHSLPLPFESPVALQVFTREKRGTAFWVVPLSTVGAPRGTRTLDLLIRSQTLYPAELVAQTVSFFLPVLPDSFYILPQLSSFVKHFFRIFYGLFADGAAILLPKPEKSDIIEPITAIPDENGRFSALKARLSF